jgi:hypothetical protein
MSFREYLESPMNEGSKGMAEQFLKDNTWKFLPQTDGTYKTDRCGMHFLKAKSAKTFLTKFSKDSGDMSLFKDGSWVLDIGRFDPEHLLCGSKSDNAEEMLNDYID